MKLRILNGGHAAIAYAGALLGHTNAHEAMADPDIAAWLQAVLTREVIPTLGRIGGVSYDTYLAKIVERFANPRVADTIARLCLAGSNRQPKFILPTVQDALAAGRPVAGLALEVALWCRFCRGLDEAGRPIVIDDQRAEALRDRATAARTDPRAFLHLRDVFGELGQRPNFADAFSDALSGRYAKGTRVMVRTYVSTMGSTAGWRSGTELLQSPAAGVEPSADQAARGAARCALTLRTAPHVAYAAMARSRR